MKPLSVSRLSEPGLHFVGGVSGLALQVLPSGSRSWILRTKIGSKRREMGLGGYPDVPLADAREAARKAKEKITAGIDPISQAKAVKSKLKADQAAALTFKQCAERYIEAHESTWTNAKHAEQWRNTLRDFAYPAMGPLLVRDVTLAHVLAAIEPIWRTKTETASRLRGRIESVLDWATVRGYRDGLNPARWRGHLAKLLPAPAKIQKIEHYAAVPIDDVGIFMARLRSVPGIGARALEFLVLTAARAGEVRGATWDEIDLESGTWTVPAERMKAGKEHRVPLSKPAIVLLKSVPLFDGINLVFPAPRGVALSDMTMTLVMRRMEVAAVPHGFRSTFRDWAAERTNYPRDVAEMALAHTIGDKVEAAYRRGDLFDKRRRMMADWASFCGKVEVKSAKVNPIGRRSA